jgi:hypothetical protein
MRNLMGKLMTKRKLMKMLYNVGLRSMRKQKKRMPYRTKETMEVFKLRLGPRKLRKRKKRMMRLKIRNY